MGAGGGGAWKVAYADFVTGMMAFFMVMWIVAQDEKTKGELASYFRNRMMSTVKNSSESFLKRPRNPMGPRIVPSSLKTNRPFLWNSCSAWMNGSSERLWKTRNGRTPSR